MIVCMALASLIVVLAVYVIELVKGYSHKWSFWIAMLAIIILMAGNSDNADYENYQLRYNQTLAGTYHGSLEWAHFRLLKIFGMLGASYRTYRFFLIVACCLLLAAAIKKVVGYATEALLMYSVYTMVIDATQIKNFVAMVVLTYAICTCMVEKTKSAKLKYVLWIALAAGFHVSAWIYLPLVVAMGNGLRRDQVRTLAVVMVLFVLIFSNRYMLNHLELMVNSLVGERLETRLSTFFNKKVNWGFLVYWLAQAAFFGMAYYARSCVGRRRGESPEWDRHYNFVDMVYRCSIYTFFFMPLYMYAQDFSRMLRNFAPVLYLSILLADRALAKSRITVTTTKQLLLRTGTLVYLMYMYRWDIAIYYRTVVLPFFTNNWILGS